MMFFQNELYEREIRFLTCEILSIRIEEFLVYKLYKMY